MGVSFSRIKGNNVDSSDIIKVDVEGPDAEKQLQPTEGIDNDAPVPATTANTTPSTTIDDITTSRVTTGTSNLGVNWDGTAVDSGSQSEVSVGDEASVSSSNQTFTTCTSATNFNNKNSGTGPNEEPDEEAGDNTNVNDNVEGKEGIKVTYENAMNVVKTTMGTVASTGAKQRDTADTSVVGSSPHHQDFDLPSGEMDEEGRPGVCYVRYPPPRLPPPPNREGPSHGEQDHPSIPADPSEPSFAVPPTASAYIVPDDDRVELPRAIVQQGQPSPPIRRWYWPAAMIVALVLLVVIVVGVAIVLAMLSSWYSSDNVGNPAQPSLPRPEAKDYVRHLLPNYTISAMEQDMSSPQALAFDWVIKDTDLHSYPDWRILQRFALVTFYYATNGDSWVANYGWLNYEVHECDWHDFSYEALMALKDLIFDVYSFDVEHAPNLPSTSLESLKHASPCGEESEISQGIYRHVWQSNNLLKGTLPPELFLLTNLRSLLLAMSEIKGTIPSQVGQLTNLNELVTWNVGLKGSIPTEIGMLSNLLMQIHFGSFLSGAIPSEIQHLTNLEIMSVTDNQLTSIPESFGLLSKLKDLDFGKNKILKVPTEVGQLTAMTALGLYANNLQDFPSGISSLTSLESLGMWSNPLKASIPTDIGMLTALKHLFLYNTSLTGSLPSEIGLLSSLEYLRIGDNHLAGEIPEELFDLAMSSSMVDLNVLGNILLQGTIPEGVCDAGVFLFNCTSRLCGCACTCPALNQTV